MPAVPLQLHPMQPQRTMPYGEIVLAALSPFLTCGLGNWVFFAYTAIRRNDKRQFVVSAIYALTIFGAFLAALVVNQSPDDDDMTTSSNIGFALLFLGPVVASVHGVLLAITGADHKRDWVARQTARQFAAFQPDRAREIGVGRPHLPRGFLDGGLVDLNHASWAELCELPGVTASTAHTIVMDRQTNGYYLHAGELLIRGLVKGRVLRRLTDLVICIPVGSAALPRHLATMNRTGTFPGETSTYPIVPGAPSMNRPVASFVPPSTLVPPPGLMPAAGLTPSAGFVSPTGPVPPISSVPPANPGARPSAVPSNLGAADPGPAESALPNATPSDSAPPDSASDPERD